MADGAIDPVGPKFHKPPIPTPLPLPVRVQGCAALCVIALHRMADGPHPVVILGVGESSCC
jgi:hypothetical protein